MDWKQFCEKIIKIVGPIKDSAGFQIFDDRIEYTISDEQYVYTAEEFAALTQRSQQYIFTSCAKFNDKSYEALVDFLSSDSRRPFYGVTERLYDLNVEDKEEKISYSFGDASEELILHIIESYSELRILRLPSAFIHRKIEESAKKDLFSLINLFLRAPKSIYLKAETAHPDLTVYAKSYLFNIAYNYNYVLSIITELDDDFPSRPFMGASRRHSLKELSAPRLAYKEELVEQYYMALLSENAFVKFIGFYHIMEHFYDSVYNDEILNSVRSIIQHPAFSSKRKTDISKIVELIQKKTHQSKEEFQGNELEALELTLKNFIDLTDLKNDLEEMSRSLVDYYKNNEVGFSKGDPVDLYDVANDKVYKKLAARIYKTRNALVHSKSNEARTKERGIYNPFKDSQELQKEIPLMRSIAEAIIIKTSKEL